MTFDVIATARRRTRRVALIALAVLAGLAGLAGLIYGAGFYATARIEQAATLPTTPPADGSSATAVEGLWPADVTWRRLAGVDLPVSATAGPHHLNAAGVGRGYARTRTGVVFAALHLLVQTSAQAGAAVFEASFADQVVGPEAAAMRANVHTTYQQLAADAGLPPGQSPGTLPARVAGVRVDAFSDDAATIAVLTAAPDATGVLRYAITTVHMRWTGSDWALVAPAHGRWDASVRILAGVDISVYTSLPAR